MRELIIIMMLEFSRVAIKRYRGPTLDSCACYVKKRQKRKYSFSLQWVFAEINLYDHGRRQRGAKGPCPLDFHTWYKYSR